MGTVWISEAEQLAPIGTSGTMLGGPPRVVWHTTEAPSGGNYFALMDRVLTGKQAEPHILYDPVTDRMGQYFPLNKSARALRNDAVSGLSTNKTGTVCIQIEVVGYAHTPFTSYWKPGRNFRALMQAIRSWGIPDVWPAGRMSAGGESVSRSLTTYKTQAGHYGHCHVPGNTHWDCGAIDQHALFAAAGGSTSEDDDMTGEQAAQLARIENILMRRQSGGIQDLHNITSTSLAELRKLAAAVAASGDIDETTLAAALAPSVIAALGAAKGISAEDVEAAVRRVFADAAT